MSSRLPKGGAVLKFKYIKHKVGMEIKFVIFDLMSNHNEVAKQMDLKVVSAGYVFLSEAAPYCFGSSPTLRVDSEPKDSKHLETLIEEVGAVCRYTHDGIQPMDKAAITKLAEEKRNSLIY